VVIEAKDPERRPRIVYHGRTANAIEVRASHVVIRGLEIGPTQRGVDGIRVYDGSAVTIENCRFTSLRGVAVAATHASVQDLTVRGNVVVDSEATAAMYFGCHDGRQCTLSGVLVEGNYIHTVRAPRRLIGYGVQVKLESAATIRDNIIVDTMGPGIMVYGARALGERSVVEGNFTMGSLQSSGIVVGGGPAVVRNNITMLNRWAGIGLEDYGGRGLLREIAVVHNTAFMNRQGGILAPWRGLRDVLVANNAVLSPSGVPALPAGRLGLELAGNVDCARAACFADPPARDFSPRSGLVGQADRAVQRWIPADDFFGARPARRSTVGAVEGPAVPVELGPKATGTGSGDGPARGGSDADSPDRLRR
jgi:hypothetical protein